MNKIMYHVTDPRNIERILKLGLRINAERHFTIGDWDSELYNMQPIYLALNKDTLENLGYKGVVLELNVAGLDIVADIGTLIDFGAVIDSEGFYFEEDSLGYRRGFFDDQYDWRDVIEPGGVFVEDFITLTGTAACLENIAPHRIKIIEE